MSKFKLFLENHPNWPAALIVLCIFSVFWLTSFIVAIIQYQTKLGIMSWPSVSGTIVTSRVTEYKDEYCLYYNYTYEVDGKKYENRDYSFPEREKCYSIQEDAIEYKLKQGTKIGVFYNPNNHTEAYIHRTTNIPPGCLFGFLMGVFILLVSIVVSCLILFEK